MRDIVGRLGDAGMLLLLVMLLPFVILLVGAPVALIVRLLIEIARQM